MNTKLQNYFPMIRTRQEVLNEIHSKPNLNAVFLSWRKEQQQEFLDFCTGAKGVKILYDSFFKELLNPEYHPRRLEKMISLIIKSDVHILQILPNDSTRIADETSLLITDIVVELEDHSIANIEIQKIGYAFPGPRCACYSADLLLRQYKRIKNKQKKKFNYKNIKNVYTIIFIEQSASDFHEYPNTFLHYFHQTSNTGLKMDLLQEYYFVPLDICKEILQDKGIKDEFQAWLTFLCCDDPNMIVRLISNYPEFREMYEELYTLCQNVEEVMSMFSKELQELDKNTVYYMIDEMQNEIDEKKVKLEETKSKLEETEDKLTQTQEEMLKKNQQIAELQKKLEELEKK